MQLNHLIFVYVFLLMLVFAVLEALYIVLAKKEIYAWQESLATLGVALGGRVIGFALAGGVVAFAEVVWQHRLYTLPIQHPLYWPVLFILEEFLYYWFHRISHTRRWFWATHAVHHSPQHFYLSGAYRLGWTGQLTGGFLIFAPLFLLGFKPNTVFIVISINLLYQYWLHTELVGSLGWFDKYFNSPSNHRVHHSTLAPHLDKNFGGVLMIFDHLFGTYVAEDRNTPVKQFGLIHNIHSYNPIKIALHQWHAIYCEMKEKTRINDKLSILFGRP